MPDNGTSSRDHPRKTERFLNLTVNTFQTFRLQLSILYSMNVTRCCAYRVRTFDGVAMWRDEGSRVREENEQNDFLQSRFRDEERRRHSRENRSSRIPVVSVNGAVACVRDRRFSYSFSLSLSRSLRGWRVSGRINVSPSAETLETHCSRLRRRVWTERSRRTLDLDILRTRDLPGITSIPIKTSVALC